MCMLCVIQKWSRKVATMLPWLVIPLIGLWLISQFLPPAFRFEITSPRLACVLVLLVTLFWYEILMPQLSSWRARRNARLRERKRFEAIEMQKLRKSATRRCRNCFTPYRDQNPSGGKFTCSYCGHASKRPVLDLPPGLGRLSNSGIFKDLVGICGHDWVENGGNWVNGSFSRKSSYRKTNSGGFFSFVVYVFKSLAAIFLTIMWFFRKIFRISFTKDDTSLDLDINGVAIKGENGVNCNETRIEKARRKAEEKRQAKLEREQLEEEERKQREEVGRLVEERRKLRDENDKIVKIYKKDTSPRDKKEAEKKRQERRKGRERGSSKSNSDVDELERKNNYREHNISKVVVENNYNKANIGARYLDHNKTKTDSVNPTQSRVWGGNLDYTRSNFFPSSRTFTGGGVLGKGINANAKVNPNNIREQKSSAFLEISNKRDFVPPERAHGKSNAHADDQNKNRPAVFEAQPCPPPKKSWQQLFARSSTTDSSTTTNVINQPNAKLQTEPQNSIFSYPNPTSTAGPDNYEGPCYVPHPVSLTGPVSQSLNNFQLDLGFEKPSPIQSPMSRLWISDEKTDLPLEDHVIGNEKEWQMWNSSPICPDTLGLVGGNSNWYLPQKTNGFMHGTSDDPWYGAMSINHEFQPSDVGVWAKKGKAVGPVSVEGVGTTSTVISPGGGLYSCSDVHSFWSYE